jgi:hypothetical protein
MNMRHLTAAQVLCPGNQEGKMDIPQVLPSVTEQRTLVATREQEKEENRGHNGAVH